MDAREKAYEIADEVLREVTANPGDPGNWRPDGKTTAAHEWMIDPLWAAHNTLIYRAGAAGTMSDADRERVDALARAMAGQLWEVAS